MASRAAERATRTDPVRVERERILTTLLDDLDTLVEASVAAICTERSRATARRTSGSLPTSKSRWLPTTGRS